MAVLFNRLVRWAPVAVAIAMALGLSSCAHPPVAPWQREYLSRRAMSFSDGLEGRFRQHMFSTREGADGGFGTVGGGCGCN
ncbi:MAG: DUF4266 domain-containing protein [Deltaproteobacteria bacterium]|nr:DUF4266 domain-containing protein [Deltaproteobacteria bacterium]